MFKKLFIATACLTAFSLFVWSLLPKERALLLKAKHWETYTWKERLGAKREVGYDPGSDGIILDSWSEPTFSTDSDGNMKVDWDDVYLVRLYEKIDQTIGWTAADDNPRFFELKAGPEERIQRTWKFVTEWVVNETPYSNEVTKDVYLRLKPGRYYIVRTNWAGLFDIKDEFMSEVAPAGEFL